MERFRLAFLFGCLFSMTAAQAQEDCGNGIDDDGDGLIDLNDSTACACAASGGSAPNLIPNASFDDHVCNPGTNSQMHCATGWSQATEGTSDYFRVGAYMPTMFPPPVNGGSGFVGGFAMPGYIEYVGTCLDAPMETGTHYTLSLYVALFTSQADLTPGTEPQDYPPIEITIFGSTTCPTFPLPTSICPVGLGWIELGHATYDPSNAFTQVTIDVLPDEDIEAVIIGPPCDLPPGYTIVGVGNIPYFLYDEMELALPSAPIATVADTGSFCTGDRVLIAHPSVPGNAQWFLNGVALVGRTDSILDLSANDLGAGLYTFQVSLGDTACGTVDHNVVLDSAPDLEFAVSARDGCAPLTVTFGALADSVGLSAVEWDFGDGGSSALFAPTHTYTTADTFEVHVEVTARNGCSADSTFANAVIVHPDPVAGFTVDVDAGCAPVEVRFTNTTAPPATTFSWAFGDGGTSTMRHTTHTFQEEGTYDVRLTATTLDGCTDDTLMQDLIEVYDELDAGILAVPSEGFAPLTVQFSNNGQGLNAYWNLGNGTSTAVMPTWTYGTPGSYVVELIASDPGGCTDTVFTTIVVHAVVPPEMPNVFTPNGDGENDHFRPLNDGWPPYRLTVLNRWGQELFDTTDLIQGWNGRVNGETVPNGTYFWVLQPLISGAGTADLSGSVTLLGR